MPRIRQICQVVVDRALAKMPDLQLRIEHLGKGSTVSPVSMGVRTVARLQRQIFFKSSFVGGRCWCREQV